MVNSWWIQAFEVRLIVRINRISQLAGEYTSKKAKYEDCEATNRTF